ncbi:hypothetical protein AVEN_244378-1 [Araneus ventricosus]|uniref:Uncharacterized protein n=1 Tax=Araneus ventricosus TaxID=182803 RepID=A0A4Y2JLP0_ARAVE|nr:hypothetical protein AVEN_244378-1 [Araneus ventricosus]
MDSGRLLCSRQNAVPMLPVLMPCSSFQPCPLDGHGILCYRRTPSSATIPDAITQQLYLVGWTWDGALCSDRTPFMPLFPDTHYSCAVGWTVVHCVPDRTPSIAYSLMPALQQLYLRLNWT